MTEEQKRIVDDLREECNGCGGFDSEYGICMLDECMGHKSADMSRNVQKRQSPRCKSLREE